MELILDGKTINDEIEFHKFMKKELGFPDFYGENLDALWDCLTGFVELPSQITWINYTTSEALLGQDFCNQIKNVFEDLKKEYSNFDYVLVD